MSGIRSHRDLEVWRKAVDLAVQVHCLVRSLPRAEQFAVGDQLIGCSTSIPANIAEGYGRRRSREYIRFLDIANGSSCELDTRLEVCGRLGLIPREEISALQQEASGIGQMLSRLRQRIHETRR
jgi:four helix bundle protein